MDFRHSLYLLDSASLTLLIELILQLPYFFIEDVFVGGFVADRCALAKHHLQGFKMFKPNKPIKDVDMVTWKTSAFVGTKLKLFGEN